MEMEFQSDTVVMVFWKLAVEGTQRILSRYRLLYC